MKIKHIFDTIKYSLLLMCTVVKLSVVSLMLSLTWSSLAYAVVETHSGEISIDTTWSKTGVEAHWVTSTVTVPAGVTLTIEAGAVVKFSVSARLDVYGVLNAVGIADTDPIVFTSYRDDSVGGDTNADGSSVGQLGDWSGINLHLAGSTLSRFENNIFQYSGEGLYVNKSDSSIVNNIFNYNGYALYILDASPVVNNNTLADNRDALVIDDSLGVQNITLSGNSVLRNEYGIVLWGSTALIENNTISDNTAWGLFYDSWYAAPVIKNNIITGNLYPTYLPASAVPNAVDGNTLIPNTNNGLWIRGNDRATNLNLDVISSVDATLNTYHVKGELTMASGSTLSIGNGVIMKFDPNSGLNIDGTLSALGTASEPVVFTSVKDDRYGGDFNNDGNSSIPNSGDWGSLSFSDTSTANVIENAIIRYGGGLNESNLYSYYGPLILRNSAVSFSSGHGLNSFGANVTLQNNEVFANAWDGLHFEDSGTSSVTGGRIYANLQNGISVSGVASFSISNSEILGNSLYGVINTTSPVVGTVATANWWGDVSGAGGALSGQGDKVSNNVDAGAPLGTGSSISYFNAGENASLGIAAPVVVRGSPFSGASPATSGLLDLESVQLSYPSLDVNKRYDIFLTYLNPAEPTYQYSTSGSGVLIHDSVYVDNTNPQVHRFPLVVQAYASGTMGLTINSDADKSAAVSQVWLIESLSAGDTVAPVSTIAIPTNGTSLNPGGSVVTISGNSTDDLGGSGIVGVQLGINDGISTQWYKAALQSDGTWTFDWTVTSDGDYTLYASAIDNEGNRENSSSGINVSIDTMLPSQATALYAYDKPQDSGGVIELFWTLSPDDGEGSNDVVSYEVQRRTETGSFGVVGTVANGISSYSDTTTINSESYYYKIIVLDQAGNRSADSVAYGPVVALDNTISDTVPPEDVTALTAEAGNQSAYLSWTASVDSSLDLVQQLLDVSIDGGVTWGQNQPDYNDGGSIPLNKISTNQLVQNLTNGQNYTFRVRVKDSASPANVSAGVSSGAVIPSETASIAVPTTISENTTWHSGVYYIALPTTVNTGATLTLEAGTIIKFAAGATLNVLGNLQSMGEQSNPVVLTAYADDSYGGDTNGDGTGSVASPGDWGYLKLGSGNHLLRHTIVRFGGGVDTSRMVMKDEWLCNSETYSANVIADLSNLVIDGGKIEYSGSHGLFLHSGETSIDRASIINNSKNGIYSSAYAFEDWDWGLCFLGSINYLNLTRSAVTDNQGNGIEQLQSSLGINGNTIQSNGGYGINRVSGTSPYSPKNNTITNNDVALRVPVDDFPDETNTLTPNTKKFIELTYGYSKNQHWPVWGRGTNDAIGTYLISGNVMVPALSTLSVESGVILKFAQGVNLRVDGALDAVGKSEEKIVFTSDRDDSIGGDTNGDSNATAPFSGYWAGLTFSASTIDFLTKLTNVNINYAGGTGSQAITILSNITLEQSEVSNSRGAGITVSSGTPVIRENKIWGNESVGIKVLNTGVAPYIESNQITENIVDGINISYDAVPQLYKNQLLANTGFGINNSGINTIDATEHWWGDTDGTGPYHVTNNISGTGNEVSDNVVFSPYRPIAAAEYLYTNLQAPESTSAGTLPVAVLVQGTVSNEWDSLNLSPNRTMAWHTNAVVMDISGLNPAKRYAIRVSYFNGDAQDYYQSLTDGSGNTLHNSMRLPITPTQYQFLPAPDLYQSGGMQLRFVNDNPGTQPRAVVSQVMILEHITDFAPPTLQSIGFNDVDGSGTLTIGDEYHFQFSKVMDKTQLPDGGADADFSLSPSGASYGSPNSIRWSPDETKAIVTLVSGFSVSGTEAVTLSNITDRMGNAATGDHSLSTTDTVEPQIVALSFTDTDSSSTVSIGDSYTFTFSESMNSAVAINPNSDLSPDGKIYGYSSAASWNIDSTTLTVTLSDGFTISGSEKVMPSAALVDAAGNAVSNFIYLESNDLFRLTNVLYAPEINYVSSSPITLQGTRPQNTSVWVNGVEKVSLGTNDWSVPIDLVEGEQSFAVTAKNNESVDISTVSIVVVLDTAAPVILSSVPADGDYASTVGSIEVNVTETGSGIDLNTSNISVTKDGITVNGAWLWDDVNGKVTFVPGVTLAEGAYQVNGQLKDRSGLSSTPITIGFVYDKTSPPAPSIDTYPSATNQNPLTISGAKEANAALWLNGVEVVGHTAVTTWSIDYTLNSGDNNLIFTAKDQAANTSAQKLASVRFDNVAPSALLATELQVSSTQNGTVAHLDWSAYNEIVNGGDIQEYAIYRESAAFSDVSLLTPVASNGAGVKTYDVAGLTKGSTYYFAVVPVDNVSNRIATVNAVMAIAEDIVPPEDVTNLATASTTDSLTISWNHSVNTAGDLNGYKLYINADPAINIAAAQNSYTKSALTSATAYTIRVTALDTNNNESPGVTMTGVTLLDNPVLGATDAQNNRIGLSWTQSAPTNLVKEYAVYVSNSDFTTVTGQPAVTVAATETSATVAGLSNGSNYYFAVTAINLSGGEQKSVTTVSATPTADSVGPDIAAVQYNGSALVNNATLAVSGTISASVSDASGISKVDFVWDGAVIHTDVDGSDGYSAAMDLIGIADGVHTLDVIAVDTSNNSSQLAAPLSLNVALAAPAAPVISAPLSSTTINNLQINVEGDAPKSTQVQLYNNSIAFGTPVTVDALGRFNASVDLSEGSNSITATSSYLDGRGGNSSASTAVLVTVDASIPDAPGGFQVASREGGEIKLSWNQSLDNKVAGYNVYRATVPFTDPVQATKANNVQITATSYTDLPPVDGVYYYSVVAVNALGTNSSLSTQLNAASDSTPPRAVNIEYNPQGNYDAVNNRMAPGEVLVNLTVSEPLLTTPFLSIATGGAPLTVNLTRVTDTQYAGSFTITDATISGDAFALFSARDSIGNRGTQVDAGANLKIDTDGPVVTVLEVSPAEPIKTESATPSVINFTMTLDEPVANAGAIQVSYLLSGAGRVATDITTSMTQTGPLSWWGSFTLPFDAGQVDPESLSFVYSGTDDLTNTGSTILGANAFQVYQGTLPPLDIPAGLSATAQPGGQVSLSWNAVEGASEYQIYRQAPGDTGLFAYQRSTTLAYTDNTLLDGQYIYTVASVRAANGEEGISAQSASVMVSTDSVVPGAPVLQPLSLVGSGVSISWTAPVGETGLIYNVYRSSTTTLPAVPLLTGITELSVVDTAPNTNERYYAVTAVDSAGNESVPSAVLYQNVELLPVATLQVVQTDTQLPQISWSHNSATISGYNFYIGASGTPINGALLTATSYEDTGYVNDTRVYTVVAVDNTSAQSVGRTVVLPKLDLQRDTNRQVLRGVHNLLTYQVSNLSTYNLDNVRVTVTVSSPDKSVSYSHSSPTFSLAASATSNVVVTVGGHSDLPDISDLSSSVEITSANGESVTIQRNEQILVGDNALVVSLATQDMLRGGNGKVRFTLENSSEVETEILMALGSNPSNEVRFKLLDGDGNVLSSAAALQNLGSSIVQLASGKVVARIGPTATFTSDWFDLPVPANAPDNATVQLEIDKYHYHLGKTDQISINGTQRQRSTPIVNTDYYGTVDAVTPENSYGDQDVVITGQAIDRISTLAVNAVPMKLVIANGGFERAYDLVTNGTGSFSYTFKPLAGESGIYKVSVIHPDVVDRPEQGQFVINRVGFSPINFNVNLPINYDQALAVRAKAGPGDSTVQELRLVYEAADQTGGVFPTGVTVTPGAEIQVSANQAANLNFTLRGSAIGGGSLAMKVVRVLRDGLGVETGTELMQNISVNYNFSEASPALFIEPSLLESGLAQTAIVNETITLRNQGLAALENINLVLLNDNGSPAPNWVSINTSAQPGSLAVGASLAVGLSAQTNGTAEGTYSFKLRISASNYPSQDVPVVFHVTQAGEGGVLFKVTDIFTNADNSNGVNAARIFMQNELVSAQTYDGYTNTLGELDLLNVVAGKYKFRVTAANHQEVIGRLSIKAGVTASQAVFLDYNLVTVEWSVTEITLQDSYEITLNATYQTDVPAAVVVAEPSSISLPEMPTGDVFNGEFTLSNYGSIRANNLQINLPPSDDYFRFELMQGLPDSLEAKSSITVAYRVTSLKALDPAYDATASGGGCAVYNACITSNYNYECANGTVTDGSSNYCAIHSYGECTVSSGTSGGTTSGGTGGLNFSGPSGGTVGTYTSSADTISGAQCAPRSKFCPLCEAKKVLKGLTGGGE
ncbi:MAG: right-handed parallel beta-helix repeat-containing protein [Gammaproteobacteria bacterium]|nr:right-handed parallel beta-helix repeat-containing protein [Gammaproteobacteria bacterium]MDH5802731.1 right-handed parallel beta-helix repeat-containing protein [Gammaproteobacteria bacterium]